jgi:hypothetical protein
VTALAVTLLFLREVLYPGATLLGGQTVPRYDKGYLIYLDRTNLLEVHRPDGQLAYKVPVHCPGGASCSSLTVAANSRGEIAVTLAYRKAAAYAGGVQIFSAGGKPGRLIDTGRLVPQMLCFDKDDNLWVLGWQRDELRNDTEEAGDYALVRKYDQTGKELGRYLPRSLWPAPKSSPGAGSGGYWRMSAASDRIGAVIHENYAHAPAEWVEWDLSGNLLSRTPLPDISGTGRAYTSDGLLYWQSSDRQLRKLDTNTGKWTPVAVRLPEHERVPFLLGADGKNLVYRLGPGNVRLLYVTPE